MDDVHIVIAAYNEERSIGKVVRGLLDKGFSDVVVVDDGSRDDTASVALSAGASVLQHCMNRGQGAALQTGIDHALRRGAEFIVTFDADGQHSVDDIRKMVDAVKSGYDVSLGSRFVDKDSNVPFVRKLFLKGGALLMYVFYRVRLSDSHNGFRCFSRRAAERIRIDCDRMEHASEIIDKIGKCGLRYKEVPVTIRYTDYSKSKGQSSLEGFRILYKMIINKFFR